MRPWNILTQLLLITLLALSASGVVSAKVASGPQNLSPGLHQGETAFNPLTHLAKIDVSTTNVLGSPVGAKGLETEIFRAPSTGKSIEAAVSGNAAVPLDKVNIFARGKVANVSDDLKALQQLKQSSRELFDADPNNAKLLDQLKSQRHNFERSMDMKRHLENIGVFDTPANNKLIIDHLLQVGNKVTPDNRVWVPSILTGPNGSLKVESTWKILLDQRAYLSTFKLTPIKP